MEGIKTVHPSPVLLHFCLSLSVNVPSEYVFALDERSERSLTHGQRLGARPRAVFDVYLHPKQPTQAQVNLQSGQR